jgi:hypothetical protein
MTAQIQPSTIERNNIANFQIMGNLIITDLLAMGFELVFPKPPSGVNSNTSLVTLRPRVPDTNPFTADALAADSSQTWHINIDCSTAVTSTEAGSIRLCVTTPLQAPGTGTIATAVTYTTATGLATAAGSKSTAAGPTTSFWALQSGEITSGWFKKDDKIPGGITASDVGQVTIPFASMFWNGLQPTQSTTGNTLTAFTYSYHLTTAYQGMALVVWEEGQEAKGNHFSWIVVQRPVAPDTGAVLKTGRCPVFCVYSIGGGNPNNTTSPNTAAEAINPFIR